MILEDKEGNIFNVELCLKVERDSEELLLLSKALYDRVNELEEKLALVQYIGLAKDDVDNGRVTLKEDFISKRRNK